MKKVKCIETQVIYNSAREAGEKLNISYKAISKNINGKSKSAGGFHFVAITQGDIPQATNSTSDIIENSNSQESQEKVANKQKSPIEKVALEDTSDNLEKSPIKEKSPKKVTLEKSPLEKSPSDNSNKSDILESDKQATNKNDWFTRELAEQKCATKIDTQLIKSIIIPCEENVEPIIDKDALLYKYERERIDRQLKKIYQITYRTRIKRTDDFSFL